MLRQLHRSVNLLIALVLSVQIVGCGKTETSSPSPIAVEAAANPGQADHYSLRLQSNGEEIAVVDLLIDGDTAIARVLNVTERFDLKNQRWQHDDTKEWVTLAQCVSWAKKSKDKSLRSKTSVPKKSRPFVQWILDPKFDTALTGGVLTLTSGQVDYKIAVEKSDRDLTNFFRYARLNAYKKSMTDRKLPPFAELLVLNELERRGLMPKAIEIQTPAVPQAPRMEMLISSDVGEANKTVNPSGGSRGL